MDTPAPTACTVRHDVWPLGWGFYRIARVYTYSTSLPAWPHVATVWGRQRAIRRALALQARAETPAARPDPIFSTADPQGV